MTTSRLLAYLDLVLVVLVCHLARGEVEEETSTAEISGKLGRCPALIDINVDLCSRNISQCELDSDCSGRDKCCFDGCIRLCTDPTYSTCEHQLLAGEKRARALGDQVEIAKCRLDGQFEPVHCSAKTHECWCVDSTGFELAGTRVKDTETINCSAPRMCSGLMCRMLCPYDFALDSDGCPLCQCRDPCSGVKCPGNQKCHLEDVVCDSEPCPPIPSCKQARFLDSLCPSGEPLYLNDESQPFLCGIEESKPQCLPFFTCVVKENMEYGLCCPSIDKMEKPGKCPSVSANETECGDKCIDDTSCMGLLKCCQSDKCGSHCVPSNSTACEQQKLLAELLSRNEKSDRGYVPVCSTTGEFEPKQCSRNGLVCWCVDKAGNKLPRTMGPAENITCDNDAGEKSSVCDYVTCRTFCEYGFKLDEEGCQTCNCADACEGFSCAVGEQCVTTFSDSCIGEFCPSVPICKPIYEEVKKPGICPSMEEESCVNRSTTCINDDSCPSDLKCCPHACGTGCISPIQSPSRLPTMCEFLRAYALSVVDSPVAQNLAYPIPECTKDGLYEAIQCDGTGCWCVDEFGVELTGTRGSSKDVVDCTAAQPRESCLGLMCRLGCDYGFIRDELGCPICECRNPCDVVKCSDSMRCQLIEIEESCNGGFCPPIPQCIAKSKSSSAKCPFGDAFINPDTNDKLICENNSICPEDYNCHEDKAESIGICCPKLDSAICNLPIDSGSCEIFMERWAYNADTSRCESFVFGGCGGNLNNFVKRDDCENTCVVNVDNQPKSGTCPSVRDDEIGICAEECKNDYNCSGPQKCCLNGCGAHVCRDPAGSAGKPGQCPYLVPFTLENCSLDCKSDYDCADNAKCCSNGCGKSCVVPLEKTACEHLKLVSASFTRETKEHLIVSCKEDGSFEPVQCLSNNTCWCVNETGSELFGTRTQNGQPDCTTPNSCPEIDCDVACDFGLQLDRRGCPQCSCRDPCSEIQCNEDEECRMTTVKCISEPCPPVPMCLSKLDNPCPHGEPLRQITTGMMVRCGPLGEACPSSHKCHLSPLEEFAVCCLKPREVCSQPQDPGVCYAAIPRWSYNATSKTCQHFEYGGCGGNLNNFQTFADCRAVCPVETNCEHIREKNKNLMAHNNRDIFIPKCNSVTGTWEPTQCLSSLGLCWCVSRDGEQVPGSLVRGVPQCSSRVGRKFTENSLNSICEKGKNVHVCSSSLCSNKLCITQPDAICQVDPCGGCTARFYNSTGHEVDCSEGLTPCQLEMMTVLNSIPWGNIKDNTLPVDILKDVPFFPTNEKLQSNETDEMIRHKRDAVTASLSFLNKLILNESQEVPTSTETFTTPAFLPELPMEALLMTVNIPQCTNKGVYSPTQTTGVLSWCVDSEGEPIHDTLTRGDIQCSDKGEVLVREETLDVCPNSRWKPRVCKDECLTAYCSAHPAAICMADPCNNCKVSFYSKKGELLLCEEKCRQPKEIGVCRASYHRYYFNATNNQCEQFLFGGCGGNDNNFLTETECMAECAQPVNVCQQPKRIGMCRASMRRWYFNQHSQRCEQFIFGGCDGNDNNFETKEECEARCPDMVLCSSLNSLETPACSRREVCKNITCSSRDDVICTVDPCDDCKAYFVDYDGIAVSCEERSETEETTIAQTTESAETSSFVDDLLPQRSTPCRKKQSLPHVWSERIPTCDSEGRFEPTQCANEIDNTIERMCWCVDEAGNQLPSSSLFREGTQTCELKEIDVVRVKLVFQLDPAFADMNDTDIFKEAMTDILQQVEAVTASDILVQILPNTLVIQFILVGENKVDVAFELEEMLKNGVMKLLVGENSIQAVPASSSFYHEIVDYKDGTFTLSTPTVAAILIFTFLTLVLICALVAGVMVYRKRRMGFYPRGSLESLASSTSPLYAYETKTPLPEGPLIYPFRANEKKSSVSFIERDYAVLRMAQSEKNNPLV